MGVKQLPLAVKALHDLASGRDIWIWGAGNQGRGVAQVLLKYRFDPKGFIDQSEHLQGKTALGLPVHSHEDVFSSNKTNKIFVIISSFFYEEKIADQCIRNGLVKNESFISYTELKPYDFAIEVSGACNLRCLACPQATRDVQRPSAGFMSLQIFRRVVEKILRDSPFVGNLQLYQWGEPLLNPNLPDMICHANEQGIKCAVSSNLNLDNVYEKTVQARPEWFRVSCSGWGDNYETTHAGGSWKKFHNNLFKLSRLRDLYHPGMKVELYYHVYKHNSESDMEKLKELCQQLTIEFHPVYAYLIGLDDVLTHLEGGTLPPRTAEAANMLCLPLEDGLALARQEIGRECSALRCVLVNWDLNVSNCMMYYYPESNIAAANFLETSLESIQKTRLGCSLCKRCKKHALHRYCGVYATSYPAEDTAVVSCSGGGRL